MLQIGRELNTPIILLKKDLGDILKLMASFKEVVLSGDADGLNRLKISERIESIQQHIPCTCKT